MVNKSSFGVFGVRKSSHSLCMTLAFTFIVSFIGFSGCGDDEPEQPPQLTMMVDQGIACEVRVNDCPNVCIHGTGIVGEQCADTDSCACGLFCDEGRCQPYRDQYQGCRCEGEIPQTLSFAESCNADTEGAPCNDLNPCTIDDYCAQGRCIGSPTPYPAACDDGNSCTSGDVCAGATCQGNEKADGERCDDGLRCTESDLCSAGECIGVETDCSASANQCNLGVCDPQTGTCLTQPKPSGETCDDGNYCTLNEQCEAGSCIATEQVDCSGSATACLSALCDPLSGACLLEERPDGIYCDSDENACTQEQCQEGECVTQYTVRCEELCNDGLCDHNTGRCTGQALPNGTACDDQDSCTENSECRGGSCFITALLCACDDLDEGDLCDDGNECTIESRCNAEGECVEQGFAEMGVSCDLDGNQCTAGLCDGQGSCVESDPLDCSDAFTMDELGSCQVGQCSPETGECSIVAIAGGISCSTNNLCDEEGSCQNGRCIASPKDCSSDNNACGEGVCDPADGLCKTELFPVGTPCQDGDLCTAAGRCTPVDGVLTCQDQIITDNGQNLCDLCVGLNEDDDCDDGNACTEQSRCVRRGQVLVCLGANKVCDREAFDEDLSRCQQPLCDPLTGACTIAQELPIGSRCNDQQNCTRQDLCLRSEALTTCIGTHQQEEVINCPEGDSLLNPTHLDQAVTDLGLVDQCVDHTMGQNAVTAHQVSTLLATDDLTGKLLSNLDRDRTEEWFSLQLNAHEHLSLEVTDRCGASLPLVLSILNATGTRDLSAAQRVSTMQMATRVDLDITESAEYLVKVDLGRSLSPEEVEVPYVLHINRAEYLNCDAADDCCSEEVCSPIINDENEASEELYCQTLMMREDENNDRPISASRLLFFGDIKQAKRVGSLSDRFEDDWFKVRLEANHVYNFTTQGYCGKPIDTLLSLYSDPTQAPIMVNDNHSGQEDELLVGSSKIRGVMSEETTDYYLKVEGGSRSTEPYGSYTMIAEDVSCNPVAEESECLCTAQRCVAIPDDQQIGQCIPRFSEREPNETESSARENNNLVVRDTAFMGQIDRVGDRDTYLITLPPGRFKIETNGYCEQRAINTALRVMNLSGLTLAEDEDSGAGRLATIEEFMVLTEQDFLIEVRGTGGSVGHYLLEVGTLSIDDGGGEMNGICQVDADCQCQDLTCRVDSDGTRSCEPRLLEVEPNQQRFDATSLPFAERMTGQLESISDVDLYRITLSQDLLGESVIFAIDTACEGLGIETQLRLLDASGVEISIGEAWRDGHLVATPLFEVNQTGDYYLEVSSLSASRGVYVITSETVINEAYIPLDQRTCFNDAQCQCPSLRCNAGVNNEGQCLAIGARELEPNDQADQARLIDVDSSIMGRVTGSLSSLEDIDYYRVEFGPEQRWRRFSITMSNVCEQPTPPSVRFSVYNPQGVLLFEREGTTDSTAILERATISEIGPYLIVVQYTAEATESQHRTYRLEINPELGCEDPSDENTLESGEFCLCEHLLCEFRESEDCLSPEIEPNSLPSFPQRLSINSGKHIYGRIDELGDRDYYSLSFEEAQRGALFKIDLLPFCQQAELPLSRTVTHAFSEEIILSEDANGQATNNSTRPILGAGLIRAESNLPLILDLNRAPIDGVESPVSGEYILDISPINCEIDSDCLCDTVSCHNNQCRADYDELEPNNRQETATQVIEGAVFDVGSQKIISGHLGGETQGDGAVDNRVLDVTDFWRLPSMALDPNSTLTLKIRPQGFCESPQVETFLSLKAMVQTVPEPDYEPVVLTILEDEEGSYYEAEINRSGDHVLEVFWQNQIGSYQFQMSLTSTPIVP